MMLISNNIFPYRIDIKSKEPLQFEVILKNPNPLPKTISYEILFPDGITIDSKGAKKSEIYKLGEFKSGEARSFKYRLYPNTNLRVGKIEIIVRAYEHYGAYDNIEQTTEKVIIIRVV